MQRNYNFDNAKGLLIILVIIGHVILGDMNQTPSRHIIYFFHMPLFLAITGYFLTIKNLQLNPKAFFKKYIYRLIIPFLLAYVFYNIAINIQKSPIDVIKSLFSPYPYYHLWYIPAFFIFALYTKILKILWDKQLNKWVYAILTLFLALTIYFETHLQWNLHDNPIYQWLGDKKFYYFYSYFLLGFLLCQLKNKITFKLLPILLMIIGLGLYIGNLMNFVNIELLRGIDKVMTNMGLIILVIQYCQKRLGHDNFLAKIGNVSLPIYLWHVFPLLVLQKLNLPEIQYYLFSFIVFTVFIVMSIYLNGKNPYIDKYFYGRI